MRTGQIIGSRRTLLRQRIPELAEGIAKANRCTDV